MDHLFSNGLAVVSLVALVVAILKRRPGSSKLRKPAKRQSWPEFVRDARRKVYDARQPEHRTRRKR